MLNPSAPLRMASVQDPVIPLVGEMIRKHPGTISLGQGVVHYGPPPEAAEAISRFLAQQDAHKYGPVAGIPALHDVIRDKLGPENGIELGRGNALVVTAGGNMAFMNAVLAVADPGDEIILQTPYYFNHEMAVAIAGCQTVMVPTDANYQLNIDLIARAITNRTRAVVTISPNNPTGAVYPEADLRAVNEICRDRGLYHIHDEAYEYFTYDGACHFSPGSIPGSEGHTISLYSLSKAYGFASWRIGYMVVPEDLLVRIKKIQDTILICPPVISQYAAVGALSRGAPYCLNHLSAYSEVRSMATAKFEEIQDICQAPLAQGAFYFLLKLKTDRPAMEVVETLIAKHGVAAMPGTTFGLQDGCSLRVSYGALLKETAVEGIGRLVRGIREIA